MEKPDVEQVLELEKLLLQGGRPLKEDKESITLRISAPLARMAQESLKDQRSRIYELGLITALRDSGALPPALSTIKTDKKPVPLDFDPSLAERRIKLDAAMLKEDRKSTKPKK